ncbi:Gfo/Idh/MocA family oxidoreductase [Paenibacillus sp. JMULE4]|uniref:Gfo/Idh/MocA family protein n=1 Tax=Paenibacillus sp. JMULE4 TaxID=2518342 RepID=UPI0015769D58|nr:Gfo/Idh/MocA family oxidoreductase [Paenibacillus sp. JMULE4]NTZ20265.1 Gfo/Idh/MocA family oxidoreductase [Paenibacillus sp. JMULE4]
MVNFAIIGCGHIAKKHIESIQRTENANLVAVCDNDSLKLKEITTTFSVNGYLSVNEMLDNQPEIHVVNICVPSGLHASIATEVANRKKHVILEKPMAITLEDADSIIEACKRNDVKLTIVHPNRFRPAFIELKKALDDNLFGKLSHINATVRWNRNQEYYDQAAWRGTKEMDGGVLMNQAIHNLDIMLWMMGPYTEIQAYTATQIRNIESEDVAVALIKFNNGAIGVVETATTIYPKNLEESISVFGEKGTVIIGGPTANWIKNWTFEDQSVEVSNSIINKINEDPFGVSGHQKIIEDMIDAIINDRAPIVSGEEGRNALKLVKDIYKAAESKSLVY